MKVSIDVGGTSREVTIERLDAQRYAITFDGEETKIVDAVRPQPGVLSLLIDSRSYEVDLHRVGPRMEGKTLIDILGTPHTVTATDPRKKALRMAKGATSGEISTAMPGRVVRVLVEVGDTVQAGQPVVVIEAMKMENEMPSPIDGVVQAVHIVEGETVESNAALLSIAPASD
jgi:biotin carboxyl carrier protein